MGLVPRFPSTNGSGPGNHHSRHRGGGCRVCAWLRGRQVGGLARGAGASLRCGGDVGATAIVDRGHDATNPHVPPTCRMSYSFTLMLIGGLYLLAAASPGPNFFIISQLALVGRQRQARLVAFGIALGSTIWATAAVAGLSALLSSFDHFAAVLRIAGAVYLVWYGSKLLRSAAKKRQRTASDDAIESVARTGFRTGLFTSLTNPKSAAFWSSVFAAILPIGAPVWFLVTVCALIATLSALWHFGLALVFSRPALQAAYTRARRPVEAVCGGALVALGLRRAFTQ